MRNRNFKYKIDLDIQPNFRTYGLQKYEKKYWLMRFSVLIGRNRKYNKIGVFWSHQRVTGKMG